jgi:hypothetical protein
MKWITGLAFVLLLGSFSAAKYEGAHLITGTWSLVKAEPGAEMFTRGLMLQQVYFGSVGGGSFSLRKKTSEAESKFVYHMAPTADSLSELCIIHSSGNGGFGQIVFRVMELSKRLLTLRFEFKDSARYYPVPQLMTFERIAGPPENME